MKTALITGKTDNSDLAPIFEKLIALLKNCGWHSFVIPKTYQPKEPFDIAFCIGGDGSFLSAARTLAKYKKPLVIVYAGSLGFLPCLQPSNLSEKTVQPFLEDTYPWMKRMMLTGECSNVEHLCALNEFYFTNNQKGSLSDYLIHIDGDPVMKVRADGLIISSPTGSTAYNLSAGGPILLPTLQALVITPVCSHILGERPFVVGIENQVCIVNQNKKPSQVWADGQEVINLNHEETFHITKPLTIKTQAVGSAEFFGGLSLKLGWNGPFIKE